MIIIIIMIIINLDKVESETH